MSKEVNMMATPLELRGTPTEIGFQVFDIFLLPILQNGLERMQSPALFDLANAMLISLGTYMAEVHSDPTAIAALRDLADRIEADRPTSPTTH